MGDVMKIFRYLDDLMILAGAGLITYGAYLCHPIAGIFMAGGLLIVGGVAVGLGNDGGNDADQSAEKGS